MDPSRDNLFLRFTTFWWAIGTFLVFMLALAVIWLFNRDRPADLEDAAAKPRYEIRAKIDSAQAASLSPEAIDAVVGAVAKRIAAAKPVAVEIPAQIVPGSETSKKLADAPAVDTSAMDAAPADAEELPIDPAVMELGKAQYIVCGACHGQEGEGGPIAPPLANSEWVTGPVSNLIKIQLRGYIGPITVAGKVYDMPGGMVPLAYQDDDQIAAVLTFIRNSFGHKASAVTPEMVASLRGEVGKPQLTEAELTKP